MKIYIVSQSGFQNLGDDIILKTWIETIHGAYPGTPVIVDSASPGLTGYLLSQKKDVTVVDFWWRLSRLMLDGSVFSLESLRCEYDCVNLAEESLGGVTHVIFVGGGYINTEYRPNLLIPHIASEFKSRLGFKIFASGLGMMPIVENPTDQVYRHFVRALHDFESIDVRDEESERYLKRCGLKNVTKTCDDVFLAPLDRYIRCDEKTEHEGGRLILAVHGNCGRDNEIIDFCYRLAKFHPNSVNGVICLLFGDEDIRTAERIAVALGDKYNVTFRRFKELYGGGLVLRREDYAFTTKFHGHLLLSLAGLKGMVSSIDQHYYDIKQHSLLKLGSQYKAVGLHDHYFGEHDLNFEGWGGGLRSAYPQLNGMKAELVKAIFADVEAPVVEHACLGVLPIRESVSHVKDSQVVPDAGTTLDTLKAVWSPDVGNFHQ